MPKDQAPRKANISTHDYFFSGMMKNQEIVRDFLLNIWQPVECINLSSICPHATKFISDDFRRLESDVLFSFEVDSGESVFVLIEHQSTAKKIMPFKMWGYVHQIMAKFKHLGETRYPLVIQVVFYNGREKYRQPCCLADLIDAKSQWIDYYLGNIQPFILVDVNDISDEQLHEATWLNIMTYYMKYIYAKNLLEKIKESMFRLKSVLELTEDSDAESYIKLIINYVCYSRDDIEREDLADLFSNGLALQQREVIVILVEQWREEGRQQGMQQGRFQMIQAFAKNLSGKGLSMEEVAATFQVSLSELESILNSEV